MENNKKIKIVKIKNNIKVKTDKWVSMKDALLNCPIGSKVFLYNKEVFVKYAYNIFVDRFGMRINVDDLLNEVITEIQVSDYTTIVKPKVEILDKVEREYLNAVIKPFRSKVASIRKDTDNLGYEFLCIVIKEGSFEYEMNFPDFKAGTMYKGMDCRTYTLKELGLEGE